MTKKTIFIVVLIYVLLPMDLMPGVPIDDIAAIIVGYLFNKQLERNQEEHANNYQIEEVN